MTDTATGGMRVRREATGWGWVLASGIVGVVLGIVALLFPGAAIIGAAIALGLGLVVQGVLEIVVAVRAPTGTAGRGWIGAFGVVALIAGILVVFRPGGGVLILVWGLILWFLVAGVHDLVVAGSQREHRGWNIAVGVLGILAGLVLLVSPGTALGLIAVFVALGFLLRGVADIGLAMSMRKAAQPSAGASEPAPGGPAPV
ncbi:HdeD family acid-resistance protein [Pseudonocardia endophytica]|uniref:Uncharacterized membrane protein HdeD (DUF308 family) n=1 Tax=Pseudonocardia endophytica TaxID=401976 RepID=A0A4R1HMD7_PSEEN|nr:DUF308 domain-containing protein [Pseudonocardia endophytica]TCK21715.1 uncharacterized membrane protein HdeD (DUF308 family) [Pseudonocardia endophytica]